MIASAISHDWDMSFEKFGGLLVTHILFCEKINFQLSDKLIYKSMNPNEFGKVPHTIWCKIPLGRVC